MMPSPVNKFQTACGGQMKRTLKGFAKPLLDQIKNKTTFKKCERNIRPSIRAWQLQTI